MAASLSPDDVSASRAVKAGGIPARLLTDMSPPRGGMKYRQSLIGASADELLVKFRAHDRPASGRTRRWPGRCATCRGEIAECTDEGKSEKYRVEARYLMA